MEGILIDCSGRAQPSVEMLPHRQGVQGYVRVSQQAVSSMAAALTSLSDYKV